MAFFTKKKKSEKKKPAEFKSFQEIIHQRVLTAEGWRRKLLKKVKKSKTA